MDRPAPFALLTRGLLACLLLAGLSSAGGWSMEVMAGTASPVRWWDPRTNWTVHGLYEIDQMVLVGPGFGYEGATGKPAGMAGAKLQVRLPIGRQLLPYLASEAGAALRPHLEDSWFLWRAGGGLDLKLGDRSCLLAEGGRTSLARWYARAGLLLDL